MLDFLFTFQKSSIPGIYSHADIRIAVENGLYIDLRVYP